MKIFLHGENRSQPRTITVVNDRRNDEEYDGVKGGEGVSKLMENK